MDKKIIVIAGPTASGKTNLGVELCKKYNGEIISADSRQVYRGLDLGTGKDLHEYGDVPYHLIDICDAGQDFNMFDWLKLARNSIDDIFSREKVPFVVGGTGLYIQGLVEGFKLNQDLKIKNQNGDIEIDKFCRKDLEKKSLEQLQDIYSKLQTPAPQPDLSNPHRLIRAIERAQEGVVPTKSEPNFSSLQLAIKIPRDELYRRIDLRVDQRFQEGMLEEITSLISSGVDTDWLKSLGLEYKFITSYILDNFSDSEIKNIAYDDVRDTPQFSQMSTVLKNKSHAFARRQLTWFRRFPEITWIEKSESAISLVDNFL